MGFHAAHPSNLLLTTDDGDEKKVPYVDLPSTPILHVNYTLLCNDTGSFPIFRMVNKLTSDFLENLESKRSSMQFYPFDKIGLIHIQLNHMIWS